MPGIFVRVSQFARNGRCALTTDHSIIIKDIQYHRFSPPREKFPPPGDPRAAPLLCAEVASIETQAGKELGPATASSCCARAAVKQGAATAVSLFRPRANRTLG